MSSEVGMKEISGRDNCLEETNRRKQGSFIVAKVIQETQLPDQTAEQNMQIDVDLVQDELE
jgi:hypothetical protein